MKEKDELELIKQISAVRIKSTAEKLSRHVWRVPGSKSERAAAEEIADELRRLDMKVDIEEFEAASWEHGPAELSVGGKKYEVQFMPYSPPAKEGGSKGSLENLKFSFPKEYSTVGNGPKIILFDWNQSAGVHYQELSAAQSGKDIAALVVASEFEGSFRIDSVPMLQKPFKFPIVSIRKEDAAGIRKAIAGEGSQAVLTGKSKIIEGAMSENVIAHKTGSIEPDSKIVVSAHHDGWFSAANDNLSAIGCMLETAKILSNVETRRSFDFISFGSEEAGSQGYQYYLWGSRNYVKWHAEEMNKVACILNSEMVGNTNTNHLLVDCTPDLVSFFETVFEVIEKRPLAKKLMVQTSVAVPTSTQADQINFVRAGAPSSLLYWAWFDQYHTNLDTADKLSVDHLQLFAELLLLSAIRYSQSEVLPASLTRYARILRAGHSVVTSHLSIELGRVSVPGIDQSRRLMSKWLDFDGAIDALDSFSKVAASFERKISDAKPESIPTFNAAMLKSCMLLNSSLCRSGGILGEDPLFPGFLAYANELRNIDQAVESLLRIGGSDIPAQIRESMVPMYEPEIPSSKFDVSLELASLQKKSFELINCLQGEIGRITTALTEAEIPLKMR